MVIRQKGEFQNGCHKKTKQAKFFRKRKFSYLLIRTCTCAYLGVRNVCFSEKFGLLCFLVTPVLKFPFCLIADDKRFPVDW